MNSIHKAFKIASSEITPPEVYAQRRQWLQLMAGSAAGSLLAAWPEARAAGQAAKLPGAKSAVAGAMVLDKQTSLQDASSYNNYYEFGTDKADPARTAGSLKTHPWRISVEGEVKKPGVFDLDALLKLSPMEERIYRLRCVEGWSMVIPWMGFPLGRLLKAVQPTSSAKYVAFQTLMDDTQFPEQRNHGYPWPYTEGLRLDEAMNDLALLATGMYGKTLPNQSGAPLRLAVPWKYGFKSIKAIIKIDLVEQMPKTMWSTLAPDEYGFYANVNPQVRHPRWSQATERRIGDLNRRKTLMFNGYGDQVASLYSNMDLTNDF